MARAVAFARSSADSSGRIGASPGDTRCFSRSRHWTAARTLYLRIRRLFYRIEGHLEVVLFFVVPSLDNIRHAKVVEAIIHSDLSFDFLAAEKGGLAWTPCAAGDSSNSGAFRAALRKAARATRTVGIA